MTLAKSLIQEQLSRGGIASSLATSVIPAIGSGSGLLTPTEYLTGLTFATTSDVHTLSNNMDWTNDWSLALWIKSTVATSGDISPYGINANNASHYCRIAPLDHRSTSEVIAGGFTGGTNSVRHPNLLLEPNFDQDEWNHWCMSWTASANEFSYYWNGSAIPNNPFSMSAPITVANEITLGCRRIVASLRSEMLLTGNMDDVRHFNDTAIDSDEVAAIYAATLHS